MRRELRGARAQDEDVALRRLVRRRRLFRGREGHHVPDGRQHAGERRGVLDGDHRQAPDEHFDARGVRRPERDARELVRRPHREVHVPPPDAFLEVRLEQAEAARGLGARVGPPVAPAPSGRASDHYHLSSVRWIFTSQVALPSCASANLQVRSASKTRRRPAAGACGPPRSIEARTRPSPSRAIENRSATVRWAWIGHAAAVRGALSGGRALGAGAGRFLGRKSGASGFFFAVVGGGAAGLVDRGRRRRRGSRRRWRRRRRAQRGRRAAGAAPGCRLRLTRGLAPAGGFARGLAAAGAGAGADAGSDRVSAARRCRWRSRGTALRHQNGRRCIEYMSRSSFALRRLALRQPLVRSVASVAPSAAATGAFALSLKPEQAGASMRLWNEPELAPAKFKPIWGSIDAPLVCKTLASCASFCAGAGHLCARDADGSF